MSFLNGNMLPSLPSLHKDSTPSKSTRRAERKSRKAHRNTSLISPLLSIIQDPAGSLGGLLENVWSTPSVDPAKGPTAEDKETRTLLLQHRMQTAETYEHWKTAASELDRLDGLEEWKFDPVSEHYDYALLQKRVEELNHARISGDPKRMLFLLRTSLTRGLGGMGDVNLYKHTRVGTKKLIDDYIAAACDTMTTFLEHLNNGRSCGIDRRDALQQLLNARQSFGRSALLLSGGGTWGMTHIGVVKCLWEKNMLPRIVCGSSAGSIICSVLCAKTDAELEYTMMEMCTGDLDVFEKSGAEENFLKRAARLAKYGALYDISHLTRVMKGLLGDLTFQEAYYRTGRLLNISVSTSGLHELPRLLNYVTAPNVIIWSAVAASCSVPMIFTPITLLAKDRRTGEGIPWNPAEQLWIDGSVDNDLPMARLSEMFNVNHFIVSQVNPHVIPFLVGDANVLPNTSTGNSSNAYTVASTWLNNIASFAKSEASHRMHMLSEMGIFPNYHTKLRSLLSQKYAGDITILPEIPFSQFPLVLKNPTPEFMMNSMMTGERATWPHLARVQNHCAIELALDKLTQELRTHIVFSPSQVDLRLASLGPGLNAPSTVGRRRPRHRAKTKSWCADTPLAAKFQMTPERSSANDVPLSTEWTVGAEAETTAHEEFSDEDDDEGDNEFLTFDSFVRKKAAKDANKTNFPRSEPATSPARTPTAGTFGQSLRRLFPNGSNPGTPRPQFQSLSSLIGSDNKPTDGGADASNAIRWALSPTEEFEANQLAATNSMQAEPPAAALGVDSQLDRKTSAAAAAANNGLVHANTTSGEKGGVGVATSPMSLPLDVKGIKNMMRRKKSSR